MDREEIKQIISELHKENLPSAVYRQKLQELFKFRSMLEFDHPWLPEVNNTITNCQNFLKIKIHEEQTSIPALIKRSLVTETLKFMVPFILGFAVAFYGIPNFTKENASTSVEKRPETTSQSQ